MEILVERNPACKGFEPTSFVELSPPVLLKRIQVIWRDIRQGIEEYVWAEIFGWDKTEGGTRCPADAMRVRDPEGEEGILVYGGNWGLRFRVGEEWACEPVLWVTLEEAPETFEPAVLARLGVVTG